MLLWLDGEQIGLLVALRCTIKGKIVPFDTTVAQEYGEVLTLRRALRNPNDTFNAREPALCATKSV